MTVTLTKNGPVAEVLLNRPEKMNAVDASIFEGLPAIGEQIRADRSIRAVVLSGAGENFSAGVDLMFMQGALTLDSFREKALNLPQGQSANYFQRPSTIWQDVEVPVICALHGVSFGAGCQIALGADIRIAAPGTRMSVMEMKWGLVPDMGITNSLPPPPAARSGQRTCPDRPRCRGGGSRIAWSCHPSLRDPARRRPRSGRNPRQQKPGRHPRGQKTPERRLEHHTAAWPQARSGAASPTPRPAKPDGSGHGQPAKTRTEL